MNRILVHSAVLAHRQIANVLPDILAFHQVAREFRLDNVRLELLASRPIADVLPGTQERRPIARQSDNARIIKSAFHRIVNVNQDSRTSRVLVDQLLKQIVHMERLEHHQTVFARQVLLENREIVSRSQLANFLIAKLAYVQPVTPAPHPIALRFHVQQVTQADRVIVKKLSPNSAQMATLVLRPIASQMAIVPPKKWAHRQTVSVRLVLPESRVTAGRL
jgi:hypothetical protein